MVWGLVNADRASRGAARIQAEATERAAQLQLQAQREALAAQDSALTKSLAEQQRQFDTARADWQPWRGAGMSALERMTGLMDFDPTPTAESVMAEPGYQFGLMQGRNALEGSAAAAGGLYSGRALRELTQFGNDYGTTKFNDAWQRAQTGFGNRWGRLAQLAGVGQSATQATTQAGQAFADNTANLYGNNANARTGVLMGTAGNLANLWTNNANAQAAGKMHRAKIWNDGINQLASLAIGGG